jgi:putative tryptophan/tyrosine transport system substrate-binding protein
VRRREVMALLGGAATWPLAVRAQQAAMPVIGFLNPASTEALTDPLRAFRQGLRDTGYVEGENVAISYAVADNQPERLSALAAELVRRPVDVIVATGGSASVAKAATTTIPIVFNVNDDPVRLGLVASLARPGGNLTGVNFVTAELVAKRLELLRELVPAVTRVAVLVNPSQPALSQATLRDMEPAARAMGMQIQVLNATTSNEIDAVARQRADALFVSPDPLFLSRRMQLTHLASRHAIPSAYALRDYVVAGGLMSYGTSLTDAYRQVGVYTGRILKGTKPSDLPVVQPSKFELVINLQAARLLGLTVPPTLLARADEVIE